MTYTVAATDGAIFAEMLSIAELRLRFPDLVQPIETGIADLDANDYPKDVTHKKRIDHPFFHRS